MRLPLLDLASVKNILGISSTTYDVALTFALDPVTDIFENYCARGLAYNDAEVEEIFGITQRIPLFRFPVTTLTEYKIDDVVETTPPPIDKTRGFLMPYYEDKNAVVKITTVSGYAVADVPADLASAFSYAVAAYSNVPPVTAPPASSAPLKSLSLGSGALAVAFDTKTAQSDYDSSDAPPLLQPYVFTLRKYRVKEYV